MDKGDVCPIYLFVTFPYNFLCREYSMVQVLFSAFGCSHLS